MPCRTPLLLAVIAAVASSACGGSRDAAPPRQPAAPRLSSCARSSPGAGAKPLGPATAGSTIALARAGDRTVAYVADEDARAVHTVDVGAAARGGEALSAPSAALLATTPLAGAPAQLLLARDGRLLVALRDAGAIQVLEPTADVAAPLERRCLAPAPAEPVALAVTPDDATVIVTSAWGAALTTYRADTMARALDVPLAREPRAVVASDDGRRAFVTHAVGGLVSVVDLTGAADQPVRRIDVSGVEETSTFGGLSALDGPDDVERGACQGFALAKSVEPAGRIFLPQVLVDPGDTGQPSEGGYGSGGAIPAEATAVAVLDEDEGRPIAASLAVGADLGQFTPGGPARGCLLPRAAIVDAARGELLVACMGIDALVAYDARAAAPHAAERRRYPVAAGPTGLALDPIGRRAVVWSQFDRTVNVIPLDAAPGLDDPDAVLTVSRIAIGGEPILDARIALGRKLFHASDPRISRDGRACASCHPAGRDDALTWATPDGPRQTPMLAGRLDDTAPYGWNGAGETVRAHLAHTFDRLGGSGLERREVDALIAYVGSIPAPPSRAGDAGLARRGAEIFRSAEAGCAACHAEGRGFTDGVAHDIGSGVKADKSPRFDTPSLRFVGGTAPYFHDGRYRTLRDVLRHANGTMGRTAHLSSQDLDALEAYLRSL